MLKLKNKGGNPGFHAHQVFARNALTPHIEDPIPTSAQRNDLQQSGSHQNKMFLSCYGDHAPRQQYCTEMIRFAMPESRFLCTEVSSGWPTNHLPPYPIQLRQDILYNAPVPATHRHYPIALPVASPTETQEAPPQRPPQTAPGSPRVALPRPTPRNPVTDQDFREHLANSAPRRRNFSLKNTRSDVRGSASLRHRSSRISQRNTSRGPRDITKYYQCLEKLPFGELEAHGSIRSRQSEVAKTNFEKRRAAQAEEGGLLVFQSDWVTTEKRREPSAKTRGA